MREGLIRFIETQPDLSVVGEAGSPQDAVECVRCCQPDVTLVDLQWWGMAGVMGCVVSTASGGELLQAIRAVHQGRLALPWDVDEAFGAHGVQRTLTPRQVEVLQLIAAGLRNADISTRLQISRQTVKLHVRAILAS